MRRDWKRVIRLAVPIVGALAMIVVQSPTGSARSVWDDLDLNDPTHLVPPPADMDRCVTAGTQRVACLTASRDSGGNSQAEVCMYDETLKLVMYWYTGLGKTACTETHHWSYLGMPGACVGTGPTGMPTGCVNADRERDSDYDGRADETVHCLVWVAGHALCFRD